MAVLLLLVGGFGILYLTEPVEEVVEEEEVEDTSTTTETQYVIYQESGDIDTVEISGPNGDYKIIQETETIEPDEDDEDGETTYSYTYYYEGYETCDITSSLSTAVQSLVKLSSNREIGEVDDLEQYGLDSDETTAITINYDDGSSDTIYVGIEGASTYGYYINYEGTVHISYINSVLLNDIIDNVNVYTYTVDTLYDDTGTEATSMFEYVTISGTNFDEPIEFVYNSVSLSNYVMTSPVSAEASMTETADLVTLLETFTADSVVALNVTEEELAEYGLDEPFATIEFALNGSEHTLSVSEQVGSIRYLVTDGNTDIVYSIAASSVSDWAEGVASEYRDVYVYLPFIATVDEFTATSEEISVVIDLDRTVDEESSTDTTVAYTYSSTYLGEEIEYTDNVTYFYSQLIGMVIINIDYAEHEDTPDLTLTYTYYDDGGTDVVEYYKIIDQDRYAAYYNGEFTATVRAATVQETIDSLPVFHESNTATDE